MRPTEFALRDIKDRIAAALGVVDEAAPDAESKSNHLRLWEAAEELHRCADEIQAILMRIKPR
ncbi:MAG: hypothetical protein ACP5R5_11530 [Armatimonadota bacterium]